jgi:hypothetical protein
MCAVLWEEYVSDVVLLTHSEYVGGEVGHQVVPQKNLDLLARQCPHMAQEDLKQVSYGTRTNTRNEK